MVEPVSHAAGKARIQRSNLDVATPTANSASKLSGASTLAGAGASETLSISAAARGLPAELKAGPPVDIETVTRIKEAISENRYPIDVQAITESLFQSFLEISR